MLLVLFSCSPAGTEDYRSIEQHNDTCLDATDPTALREELSTGTLQTVRVCPGEYIVDQLADERTLLRISRSDFTLDLTGVTIKTPVELLSTGLAKDGKRALWRVTGNDVKIRGLTFETIYPDDVLVESGGYIDSEGNVLDYGRYNADSRLRPRAGVVDFSLDGNRITLEDVTVKVRGSFPYGYGSMWAINHQGIAIPKKHSGILITGDGTILDRVTVDTAAFGHGIFVRGRNSRNITDSVTKIRNSKVLGRARVGAEMLAEGPCSLATRYCWKQFHPPEYRDHLIEATRLYSLSEDGIRAYRQARRRPEDASSPNIATGTIQVENTVVHRMRNGIQLARIASVSESKSDFDNGVRLEDGDLNQIAKKASFVRNVDVRECNGGFSIPSHSSVTHSTADLVGGPAIVHRSNPKNTFFDVQLVHHQETSHFHPVARINGSGHQIGLAEHDPPSVTRTINVGDRGPKFDRVLLPSKHGATDVILINETSHKAFIRDTATDVRLWSISGNTTVESGAVVERRNPGKWFLNERAQLQHKVSNWAGRWNPWGLPGGACFFYTGSGTFGFQGCDDPDWQGRTWRLKDEGKLQYRLDNWGGNWNPWGHTGGACFYYFGGGQFGFKGCSDPAEETKQWLARSDDKLQYVNTSWSSNPWGHRSGTCFAYAGRGEFGLVPCGASEYEGSCVNVGCDEMAPLPQLSTSPPPSPYGTEECVPQWEVHKWRLEDGRLKWRSAIDTMMLDGRIQDTGNQRCIEVDSGGKLVRVSCDTAQGTWLSRPDEALQFLASGGNSNPWGLSGGACLFIKDRKAVVRGCSDPVWMGRRWFHRVDSDEQLQYYGPNHTGEENYWGYDGGACLQYRFDETFGVGPCSHWFEQQSVREAQCSAELNL